MNALRRCRKRNLTKLEKMTVGGVYWHIEMLNLNQLRGLLRAMESCTETNCSWLSFEVSNKFKADVKRNIALIEKLKKKAA